MLTNKNEFTPVTVNTETAARLLGVSRSSVFGLLAKKSIPSLMIAGRRVIRFGDLQAFADRQTSVDDLTAEDRVARALKAAHSKRRHSPIGRVQ